MAFAARTAFVHFFHYNFRRALLHPEQHWMTSAAVVFLRMVLMGEIYRHPCFGKDDDGHLVAIVTRVLIKRHFSVGLD